MFKRLGLFGILALLATPAGAVCNGLVSQPVTAFAFETITVSTTSIGFTASLAYPTGADAQSVVAIVTTETNSIRFRTDGIAPTASVGHLVVAGSTIEVCGLPAAKAFRMIRASADATISATYYRLGP